MEITYQLTLDKNYTKAVKKISRDIYKHNKFRKIMRIGDFLLYLFCLIPSLFIAFYIMNWAEVLYDYYENILAYYAGYILFVISMLSFFYALFLNLLRTNLLYHIFFILANLYIFYSFYCFFYFKTQHFQFAILCCVFILD